MEIELDMELETEIVPPTDTAVMLHIADASWIDGDVFVTFEEDAAVIYAAIGTRDVAFYIPVEEEHPGGLRITRNHLMRLASYTVIGDVKTATFVSAEDGEKRYLRIFVSADASACSGQGIMVERESPALIFVTDGSVDDPRFTFRTLKAAFDARTPVYIYESTDYPTCNVCILAHMEIEDGFYKATFLSSNYESSVVWSFMAEGADDLLAEV